ncbi:MAG: SDR family oxidoreductase [Candidatus Omnitrophica bacterium]|nr:SDR family oxidoreductase [Candidatus Omnitrophota bacterium]
MYTILVVGAGYTGSAIGRLFVEKKQKVYGLTRSEASAKELKAQGIMPWIADLTKPETLQRLPKAHFVVICPAPDSRDEESYRRIYLDGVSHFLEAFKKNPRPHLMVYLSSTSVWADCGGEWVDETVEPNPGTTRQRILYEAERQVLRSGLPVAIFRSGGIYGPGRNRLQALREGRVSAIEEDEYMNLIHVEDIAALMPVIFKSAREGEIYAGVDDLPVKKSEYYDWLTSKLGISSVVKNRQGAAVRGKRIRNHKLKSLGYEFKYPSFREGYEDSF